MKKIALSLLIALSCISAKAADGKSLFVSFNDGSKIEFALSTLPEVTFGNDKMTVKSTATTASYELWKVSTFTYGTTTGIQQIEANSKFAFEGDRIIVDGTHNQVSAFTQLSTHQTDYITHAFLFTCIGYTSQFGTT
jgi:hypothetical protein